MDEIDDSSNSFSSADELCDLTLIVENKKIYAHKAVLAKVSPVFNRMFCSGFKESSAKEITLPDKKYEEIVELLQCLYPNILKPVDAENAQVLLSLSEEYGILILKKQIEKYFITVVTNSHDSTKTNYGNALKLKIENILNLLILAQIYRLNKLELEIIEFLSAYDDEQLEKYDVYKQQLDIDFKFKVLKLFSKKQQDKLKEKTIKLKELEDKCTRQKFDIVRLTNELDALKHIV
ncbi:unnamed protein product [Didymodactylos carnosus]|uniref:BTB domain-containing protein n=2 Tax=Didymodactylos carnosus TaxID=1234261 RepID=A0A815CW87_9BILA|nr:unnamed protein product [Didymodactylos carnosus]CAF4093544.1 unnamed protein product [Didymodactylos carnosus]